MFHYLLYRNSLLCMFHYFSLSSHTYYTPYNYALLHSLLQNFMPHPYIINSMFMLHLSFYSIMHLMPMPSNLLLYSLLSHSLPLVASFTNNMLLPLLNLYTSTSLSDSSLSNLTYYSMSLPASYYPFHMLLALYFMLMLLLLILSLNLLVHFHYSLPIHSMHIHSLFSLSHLYLLAVHIYTSSHSLYLFIHYLLLLFILLYSILMSLHFSQTMHYNYHCYSLIPNYLLLPLSLSHLALHLFII